MIIVYKGSNTKLIHGEVRDGLTIPKLRPNKEWLIGIDGSSTAYGLAIHTKDYSEVHLFMFIRPTGITADMFREELYEWLHFYLRGIPIQVVSYEKTPEGYRPPSTHAEKVMRETEAAIRNFVTSPNYLMTRGREYVFDIYPNSWKSFCVEASADNKGKIDKKLNAISVLKSCGLNPEEWISAVDAAPYIHSYDCFEALGISHYINHYVDKGGDVFRVYRNFTKIGGYLVVAKELEEEDSLMEELEFIGSFGRGKIPRFTAINEAHSLPENLFGLADAEFNHILIMEKDDPLNVYARALFNFRNEGKKLIMLATKASTSKDGAELCKKYGYTPQFI